jgi:hypothetical protein
MSFENTHAHKLVEELGKLFNYKADTSGQHVIFLGVLKTVFEDDNVTGEGIFVHTGDRGESRHAEEEDGSTFGNVCVFLSTSINLSGGLLSYFERVTNVNGLLLSSFENLNQGLVIDKGNVRFFGQLG